jgi:PE family
MSFVTVATDPVAEAAKTLEGIGSGLSAARTAAAVPTIGIAAAAQDEVSAAIAKMLGSFGRRQVRERNKRQHGSVPIAEANVAQGLLNAVNPPTEALLGQPLFGTGVGARPTARLLRGMVADFRHASSDDAVTEPICRARDAACQVGMCERQ